MDSNLEKYENMSTKEAHEAFVTGHSGSTLLDITFAMFPIFLSSWITLYIATTSNFVLKFCIEALIIVPISVLSLTLLNEYNLEISIGLFTILTILMYSNQGREIKKMNPLRDKNISSLTGTRAIINLATAIAILSVDFKCFPRRFAKTEEYGYGLMDLGAPSFVFMNGIVDAKRSKIQNSLKDGIIMVILGLVRLAMVRASDYQHHVTEYGTHANFFFILAFLKIFVSCTLPNLSQGFGISIIMSMACHEYYITNFGKDWVLGNIPRNNLLDANRELIVSLPNYISLYIIGGCFGSKLVLNQRYSSEEKWKILMITTSVSCLLVITLDHYLGIPSRRLGNFTFFILVIYYNNLLLLLLSIQEYMEGQRCSAVLNCINSKALFFFLFANIMTGLINKSINTILISDEVGYCIICVYSILLIFITSIMPNLR